MKKNKKEKIELDIKYTERLGWYQRGERPSCTGYSCISCSLHIYDYKDCFDIFGYKEIKEIYEKQKRNNKK